MRRFLAGGLALGLLVTAARSQTWHVEFGEPKIVRDSTGDHMVWTLTGGVRLLGPGLDVRGERVLIWLDYDHLPGLDEESQSGLPRRGPVPPNRRRRLTNAELRRRFDKFVQTANRATASSVSKSTASFPYGLVKAIYLEGDVSVIQDDREIAHAEKIFFSTVDDRMILEEAELRLWTEDRFGGPRVFTVRGDKLVRQGLRTSGRNVSLTACTAGEPHFEVKLGATEVIERESDFEIRTYDGKLAFYGTSILPLPNTTFRTSDQTNIPIRSLEAGYSNQDGFFGNVALEGSLNPVGSAIHEFFTGRPEDNFRGDWFLGLGWNQARGFPVEAGLVYEVPGSYRGFIDGFYMNDSGTNRREITRNVDGSLITENRRSLLHTENRIDVSDSTYLDLTAWYAGDAAVWPEFFPREYREQRIPESSIYLRHGEENRLLTAKVRANLADFSYREGGRALADFFPEELPLATFDLFSQPIAELPGEAPLLLTSSGSVGYLRKNYDATLSNPNESWFRFDEELTISTPFRLGPVGFEPFAAGRVTYYDKTNLGDDAARTAGSWGIRMGTWLGRSWEGEDGDSVRHVMSPTITIRDNFHVSEDPVDLIQFDRVDSLTEGTEISLRLLNRLQRRGATADVNEFVWLDLEQFLYPNAQRDNNGDVLGLLWYRLILTPEADWIPVPDLRFYLRGKHNWQTGRERTLDFETSFGRVLGLNWRLGYRADDTAKGQINYGAETGRVGRWTLGGNSQYDLARSEVRNYVVRLVRFDHDWNIEAGLIFDVIGNDTRFFVDFQPTLGGLFTPRDINYVTGQ